MADEELQQATTPKGLWILVVLAPVIVAIEMQANFILVRQACSVQRNLSLYVVIILAMLLTIVTAVVAVSIWRRAGTVWPGEAGDLATRIRFISVLGILSSVMSFLVIFAQGIATIHFDPCQL
jgi:vacuolar-type H+-ATPase subunit I/STV1